MPLDDGVSTERSSESLGTFLDLVVPGVTVVTFTGGEPSLSLGDKFSWDKLYVFANCRLRFSEIFGFSCAESQIEVAFFFLSEFGVTSRWFSRADLLNVALDGICEDILNTRNFNDEHVTENH